MMLVVPGASIVIPGLPLRCAVRALSCASSMNLAFQRRYLACPRSSCRPSSGLSLDLAPIVCLLAAPFKANRTCTGYSAFRGSESGSISVRVRFCLPRYSVCRGCDFGALTVSALGRVFSYCSHSSSSSGGGLGLNIWAISNLATLACSSFGVFASFARGIVKLRRPTSVAERLAFTCFLALVDI